MKKLIFFLSLLGFGSIGAAITSISLSVESNFVADIVYILMMVFMLFIVVGLIGSIIVVSTQEKK